MIQAAMQRIVCAVMLATVFIHVATAQAQEMPRAEYPDVPRGHWADEAINVISQVGLVEGLPSGKYGGGKTMTRYEFSVCITRFSTCGLRPVTPAEMEAMKLATANRVIDPRGENQIEYPDVPSRHWAAEAVKVMSRAGLIEGLPDGTFGATKPLTRYEFAVAMARRATLRNRDFKPEETKPLTISYSDVPETHWAFHAINTLNGLSILEGFADGKFHGTKPMSRYEFAVAMARFITQRER